MQKNNAHFSKFMTEQETRKNEKKLKIKYLQK